ncbi:MAG: hypothetical protein MR601_04345 [Erysipelotrichaceae bacterium]|nr:hypothetical protein [Erysipelotrichaceae bacterium]
MSFTSLVFIPFLFTSFLLYYTLKKPYRYYVLFLINILFLLTYLKINIVIISIFTIFSYFIGILIEKNKKNLFLGIFSIVLFFVILKYYNFFDKNFIVPIGMSFYSFKIISYFIDLSRKKIKAEKSFIYFFNYITFFPTLLSGPITRFNKFNESIKSSEFNYIKIRNGAFLCACGIFEKVVISDFFGIIVYNIFSNEKLTGSFTILGILLYAFQIYLDFDSYSNIAIGVSKMFGVDCGINFKTPYLSSNIKEFWRRWHISLSSWFKDYVYIPLGGNRKSKSSKNWNTIIVFVLSGMWHGSTLNFLIWGLGHGLLLVLEDSILSKFKLNKTFNLLFKIIGIFLNYIFVSVLFVFFKFEKFSDAFRTLKNVFIPMNFDYTLINLNGREWNWFIILICFMIIIEICRYFADMTSLIGKQFVVIRWVIYICMIAIFIVFGIYGLQYNPADFIYKHF